MPGVNELTTFEHGDESLLKVQLDVSGVAGAWIKGSWAFNSALFASSFKIYADGVEVEGLEIIYPTRHANGAEAWPCLARGDTDNTAGNFLEIWCKHALIDRDAVVTFDLGANVLTQGAGGNTASSGQAVTSSLTNYKADIADQMQSDGEIMFFSKANGEMPKLPRAIDQLGTPDATWAVGTEVSSSDIIDGTSDCVISMPVDMRGYDNWTTPEGVFLEIGDSNGGIYMAFDGADFRFRIGNSSSFNEFQFNAHFGSIFPFPMGESFEFTIHIQPSINRIDFYVEGVRWYRRSGAFGDWAPSANGGYGQTNGVAFAHSNTTTVPTAITGDWSLTGPARYWNNASPTIEFNANSKDWFNTGLTTVYEAKLYSSVTAAEWAKYDYVVSDFANFRSPGTVNAVKSLQFIWETLRNSTSLGGVGNPKHAAIMMEAGDTLNTDKHDHMDAYADRNGGNVFYPIPGESKTRPFCLMMYNKSGNVANDAITLDYTASTADDFRNVCRIASDYCVIEDRMFDVHCSTTLGDSHGSIEIDAPAGPVSVRLGGMRVQDHPLRPFQLRTPTSAPPVGSGGYTVGQMCFIRCMRGGSRGSLMSIGGHDSTGNIQRVQIGQYFGDNIYTEAGTQEHNIYWKGRTPYLRFLGCWYPPGPGALSKCDGLERTVFERFVGWGQRTGGMGAGHNGNESLFGTSTDRSEKSGDAAYGEKVFWVNSLSSESEDYMSAFTANIDAESYNCILFGSSEQNLIYYQNHGSSLQEAEHFSDGYRMGHVHCTFIGRTNIRLFMASTDDRSVAGSLGFHDCFGINCLYVNNGSANTSMIYADGMTIDAAQAAGRVTGHKFIGCHFTNEGSGPLLDDNGTDRADIAAVDSGVTHDLLTDCQYGAVTMPNRPPTLNPVEAYFNDNGYADRAAVRTAIDGAYWQGWDTVPLPLQIDTIIDHFRNACAPSNLIAANYGGQIPGAIPSDTTAPTLVNTSPADNATGVGVASSIVFQFSENMVIGSGAIAIVRSSDSTPVIVGSSADLVINNGTEVVWAPSGMLEEGTEYYVTAAAGILTDEAGNDWGGILNTTDLTFTTETSGAPSARSAVVGRLNVRKIRRSSVRSRFKR